MVGCLPRECFSITRPDTVRMFEPAPYASLAMTDIGSAPWWPLFWFCFMLALTVFSWFFMRTPKGAGVPIFFLDCVVLSSVLSVVFDWPDAVLRVLLVLQMGAFPPCILLILYLYNREGGRFLYAPRIRLRTAAARRRMADILPASGSVRFRLRTAAALGVAGLVSSSGLLGGSALQDFEYMIAVAALVSGFILFRYRSDIAKWFKQRGNPQSEEAPAPTPAPSTRPRRRTKPPGGRRRRRPSGK